MIYPRLKLLHQLLSEDGVIFISIDDYEYHNLVMLLNEIFGIKNKITTLIWDLGTGTQAGHFVRSHEYILVYAKNKENVPNFKGGEGLIKHSALKKISRKNPASEFVFPAGTRFDAPDGTELNDSWGGSEKTTLINGRMISEAGKLKESVTLSAGWAMKSQMQQWFYVNPDETFDTKGQKLKEFYFNSSDVLTYIKERSVTNPPTVLRQLANTKSGTSMINDIFGSNRFDFPKPIELLEFIFKLCTSNDDIILDSFAGSGSTGHAVLNLNKEDSGKRKFILIEMEDYAETLTAKRIEKVIVGYGQDSKKVLGTGGEFNFYELGLPLFDDNENLNEEVGIEKIREYIWYSETRTSFVNVRASEGHYLGKKDDTAYYFVYDKSALTTLDFDSLSEIKEKAEQYVIYADNCLLPKEFMLKNNIVFKKIPRDITRF